MSNIKILIIDDDTDLLQLTSLILKKAGYQVLTASDGLDGISKFFMHHPDLIVVDVMMPGSNGFDVCERIRKISEAPIIMLTALNQEQDMLHGLAAGADDFLSKPFNPEILLARAKTLLRRTQRLTDIENPGNADYFSYNDGYLSIDIEKHEVLIHGKQVKLTPKEFGLLVYLARNGGKLLTFEKILTNVWGTEYLGSMDHVHVYVSHLRRKIEEDPKISRYIRTVHGIGYIFEKQELGYQAEGF
ncbi:MAG TPA: response regulator transcription factor [Anaerolineales bacterium]|nr:response regulator transcription factor [Anaerolineales bacterium]